MIRFVQKALESFDLEVVHKWRNNLQGSRRHTGRVWKENSFGDHHVDHILLPVVQDSQLPGGSYFLLSQCRRICGTAASINDQCVGWFHQHVGLSRQGHIKRVQIDFQSLWKSSTSMTTLSTTSTTSPKPSTMLAISFRYKVLSVSNGRNTNTSLHWGLRWRHLSKKWK